MNGSRQEHAADCCAVLCRAVLRCAALCCAELIAVLFQACSAVLCCAACALGTLNVFQYSTIAFIGTCDVIADCLALRFSLQLWS